VGSLQHHPVCFVRAKEIGEGILSTATVDSQLIAFFITLIRLNELDLEDKDRLIASSTNVRGKTVVVKESLNFEI
jgi:hypothetical protein